MQTLKEILIETALEVVYFPVWWYSKGLKKMADFCWQKIRNGWRLSGLWSFLRNFFRPMYGARGWDAYVLTFFTRIWQMSWRAYLLLLWSLFLFSLLAAWVVLPVFAVWKLIS